jgi:hypothetical protein
MPGVEVLANALNTILRSRFYSVTPDWLAFLLADLVAAATLALLAVAQGGQETIQQLAVLAGIAAGILLAGYLLFTRFLVFPPLAPAMVSFVSAGILGLLRRSLVTSARLDSTIAGMGQGETALAEGNGAAAGAAETIARLTDARAVAIFAPGEAGKPRLAAGYGAVAEPGNPAGRAVTVRTGKGRAARFYLTQSAGEPESHEMLVTPLGDAANGAGTMVIAHDAGRKPSAETVQLPPRSPRVSPVCRRSPTRLSNPGGGSPAASKPRPSRWRD